MARATQRPKPKAKPQKKKRQKQLTPLGLIIQEKGFRPGWVVECSGISYERLRALRLGTSLPRKSEIATLAKCLRVKASELVDPNVELREHPRERVLTPQEVEYIRSNAGKIPTLEIQRHLKMKRIHLLRYIHDHKLPVMQPGTRRKK